MRKASDEQFLISCRTFDWSCAPNVVMGFGVMLVALGQMDFAVNLWQVLGFFITFLCGGALAYGFLLLLTSASVWFMRNQGLVHRGGLRAQILRGGTLKVNDTFQQG